MILNLILQTLVSAAVIGVLLFAAADTIAWPAGWAFLIEFAVSSLWIGVALARLSRALLKQRLRPPIQRDQAVGDRVFMGSMLAFWIAWTIFMGLDAVRWRWSNVPVLVQGIGGLIFALALYAAYLAMRENRFAAPVVKAQAEQVVIDTGPYRIVRHPMYAGALPYFIGVPLLLGSWWGLLAFPLAAIGIALRIGVEERMLRAALPGYDDYARRVRFRLIPGVW